MAKGKVTVNITKKEYEFIDGATGKPLARGRSLAEVIAKGHQGVDLGGYPNAIGEQTNQEEFREITKEQTLYVKCCIDGCKQVAESDIGICEDCMKKNLNKYEET